MGAGPEYLAGNGLAESLPAAGLDTDLRIVESDGARPEVAAAFELDGAISREVSSSLSRGEFPLVLSGNCNSCVGTLAGLGARDAGVVWLDGHADFHTPETTTSGFTDCMGLSTAVGHCWRRMSARVPGFEPVPEENAVLAGAREVESGEKERLEASGVKVVGKTSGDEEFLDGLGSVLAGLRGRVRGVYLHLDLDVLDPATVGPANEFAPPGGLTAAEAERAVRLIRENVGVLAAGIASYDPAHDRDGAVSRAGIRLARSLFD